MCPLLWDNIFKNSHGVQGEMKKRVLNARLKLWYMICFMFFGLIDQRRGSAVGEIQMIFSNLTGIVVALLLLPSLELTKFREKIYIIWLPICIVLTTIACLLQPYLWEYKGQWNIAAFNIAVWSFLIIYMVKERKSFGFVSKIRNPFFASLFLLLFLMVLSVHEKQHTLWYFLLFGSFYLIGIPEDRRDDFREGLLNGIIAWFFIQQVIAFGFRPYDYVRYRGLYSGETQNGLFYMIVFCAFILKWIYALQQNKKWWVRFFYFLMAAGSVSFLVYTGSRSGLLAVLAVAIVLITKYDIVLRKSFYKWLLHGVTLALCVCITLPAVYGCIRYLPTILHHPIWFEGEYVEGKSVCSFDPWDSPKYISFEEALDDSIGRIVKAFGIKYASFARTFNDIGAIKVQAAELGEPGSSPDNIFMLDNVDPDSGDQMWARKVIYAYYWQHLNLQGHKTNNQGFYTVYGRYYSHAHNIFLQMACDYGIPTGILFIGIYLYSIICALRAKNQDGYMSAAFLIAILCFGLLEMVLTPGQITVVLMWIMFYFVGLDVDKSGNRTESETAE